MKNEWRLSLPTGFRIEETTESMTVVQAEQRLLTKRANCYVRAVREGERATLYAHRITCPCCSRSFVCNGYTMVRKGRVAHFSPRRPRPPKARVTAWASPQISLFDEEDALLSLAPVAETPPEFLCPACGQISFPDNGAREVHLSLHRGKIALRCEVVSLPEIVCLYRFRDRGAHLQFPVYETVTFNLRRGRVSLRYEDGAGRLLHSEDVTDTPEHLMHGACYWTLSRQRVVARYVRRLFARAWQGPLPYSTALTDEFTLTQMTRFIGYPRSFYAGIPYESGTYRVAADFRSAARALHRVDTLPQLYAASGLPQVKSLRRILFGRPDLFFYLPEIGVMWAVLQDVNLLCRFLSGTRTYQVLSALNVRPGMQRYLQDYAAVKSPRNLLSSMEEMWEIVSSRAVDYACMSDSARRVAQAAWSGRAASDRRAGTYSVPMRPPVEQIPDSKVCGYDFVWLRSRNDYDLAACLLKNCLSEWQMQQPPVVSVRKNGRYVAAIEVAYPYVVQAFARRNSAIEADLPLYAAIQEWMARYRLRWDNEDDEGEEPD